MAAVGVKGSLSTPIVKTETSAPTNQLLNINSMADGPITHSLSEGRRQMELSYLQLQLIEKGAQELAELMKLKQQVCFCF